MNDLIGEHLASVIKLIEKHEFCRLWMTGDKILQSRMKVVPLECDQFPPTVPSNVVALKDANILTILRNSEIIFGNNIDHKDDFPIEWRLPSTLTTLSLKCKGSIWYKLGGMLKCLQNLTTLDLSVENRDIRAGERYNGLPTTVTCLTLRTFGDETLQDALTLPNLRELHLGLSFECARTEDIEYGAQHGLYPPDCGHAYDLSSTKCDTISLECRQCKLIFPPTMTRLTKYYTLSGTYQNLIEANVYKFEGVYPSLQKLRTFSTKDLSGCSKNCHISVGSFSDTMTIYKDGHLVLEDVLQAQLFSSFPVTSVDYKANWDLHAPKHILRILKELPLVTTLTVGCYEDMPVDRVESDKVKITYYQDENDGWNYE